MHAHNTRMQIARAKGMAKAHKIIERIEKAAKSDPKLQSALNAPGPKRIVIGNNDDSDSDSDGGIELGQGHPLAGMMNGLHLGGHNVFGGHNPLGDHHHIELLSK